MRANRIGMTSVKLLLAACALGLVLGFPARAREGVESLERIATVARATAAESTGRPATDLEVVPLDPRLHLARCASLPLGHPTPGARSAAQLTIEVHCNQPTWRQYVAVHVHAEERVVIVTRPLARLQKVSADDVTVLPRELALLPAG